MPSYSSPPSRAQVLRGVGIIAGPSQDQGIEAQILLRPPNVELVKHAESRPFVRAPVSCQCNNEWPEQ